MRTFIAIDLPPVIQQQLTSCQQMLKQRVDATDSGRAVRWTPVEKMHLTLRFLGETTGEQRQEMATALTTISAAQLRFELTINGLGCFPNANRPSVIWLGVGGDLVALHSLQSQIEMAARDVGFSPDKRAYSPHLTIGRVQRRAKAHTRREVGAMIRPVEQPIPPTSFSVDHITHIRSIFKPAGVVYTPLAMFRFG